MTTTLYGIPNCGTVKKARSWLESRGIAYHFHDYKKAGITESKLKGWCKAAGWEAVINRQGMTFRKLPDDAKASLNEAKVVRLLAQHTSAIRRPIVEHEGKLLVGFKEPEWDSAF